MRLPVLLFLGSAVFWLVAGSALGCLTSWKLVVPGLLDGTGWLTYGRLRQAADAAMIYGWASQAGMGAAFWLFASLGNVRLEHPRLLVTAAAFWNVGVLSGICAILAGASRSMEGINFPGPVGVLLLVAFACVGLWILLMARESGVRSLFASHWFLVAAFLWFGWSFATANVLLIWSPVSAPAQGPIGRWFASNLVWLWLVPLTLAGIYPLMARLAARPIRSYPSSIPAFWCLAFLGGWCGPGSLIGGPLPAWLASAGVAAGVMLLVPVTIITLNTLGTLQGRKLVSSPAVPFVVASLGCFVMAALQGAATPFLAVVTQFSDYLIGQNALLVLGFVSMGFFGVIHDCLPRLTRSEFHPGWTSWHFWLAVWGIGTMLFALTLGGLLQGFALYDPGVDFLSSVVLAAPFRAVSAVGSLVFLGSTLTFAAIFVRSLLEGAELLPAPRVVRPVRQPEVARA